MIVLMTEIGEKITLIFSLLSVDLSIILGDRFGTTLLNILFSDRNETWLMGGLYGT